MTLVDIKALLGVSNIRTVSDSTRVVELTNGYVHPATELEVRMWDLLTRQAVIR